MSAPTRVEDSEKGSISMTEHAAARTTRPALHAWKQGDDEALKVLNEHTGEVAMTEDESDKLRRKVDWRILPIVGFTFGLQSVDKAALGIGAVFGLITDLKLYQVVDGKVDSGRYSLVSRFYIGFVAGAAPLAVIAQKYPIGRVCAVYCFLWGVVEILTPACKNYESILALRFFLGFIEYMYSCAGFLGAICYCIYVGIAKAVPHAPGTVPDA
ncbi:hypothetical protein RQP46_006055 [Phenoliferia psychrophenolica]